MGSAKVVSHACRTSPLIPCFKALFPSPRTAERHEAPPATAAGARAMKAVALHRTADPSQRDPYGISRTGSLHEARKNASLSSTTLQGYDTSNHAAALDGPASGTLAVPIELRGQLLGVVFVDPRTEQGRRFASQQTRDSLLKYLEAAILEAGSGHARLPGHASPAPKEENNLRIRRVGANNSIFVDGHYLIKGVAGAILWKLLTDYSTQGRSEFSTRELRLEPKLQLPDVNDNLGPRLILLKSRLAQNQPHLRIESISRGRFRLVATKPFTLVES